MKRKDMLRRKKSKVFLWIGFTFIFIVCVVVNFFTMKMKSTTRTIDVMDNSNNDINESRIIRSKTLMKMSLKKFMEVNQRLSPQTSMNNNVVKNDATLSSSCECGCYRSRIKSCPRQYNIQDVIRSSDVHLTRDIVDYMDFELLKRKRQSQQACQIRLTNNNNNNNESNGGGGGQDVERDHTESGGYCLHKKSTYRGKNAIKIPFSNRDILLPVSHVNAPAYLIESLQIFIQKEQNKNNMNSISDFGAGVGQYGSNLESLFPDTLLYRGYDGAGDVEDYTFGYLQFFDLTIPLNLPVSDWVLSLEVGEHIPSQSEGMMIRNLHAHNCKGIILSWGIEGQGGDNHINLHNNEYVIQIFEELGYNYDKSETDLFRNSIPEGKVNGFWFKNSLMVFRRTEPVC